MTYKGERREALQIRKIQELKVPPTALKCDTWLTWVHNLGDQQSKSPLQDLSTGLFNKTWPTKPGDPIIYLNLFPKYTDVVMTTTGGGANATMKARNERRITGMDVYYDDPIVFLKHILVSKDYAQTLKGVSVKQQFLPLLIQIDHGTDVLGYFWLRPRARSIDENHAPFQWIDLSAYTEIDGTQDLTIRIIYYVNDFPWFAENGTVDELGGGPFDVILSPLFDESLAVLLDFRTFMEEALVNPATILSASSTILGLGMQNLVDGWLTDPMVAGLAKAAGMVAAELIAVTIGSLGLMHYYGFLDIMDYIRSPEMAFDVMKRAADVKSVALTIAGSGMVAGSNTLQKLVDDAQVGLEAIRGITSLIKMSGIAISGVGTYVFANALLNLLDDIAIEVEP